MEMRLLNNTVFLSEMSSQDVCQKGGHATSREECLNGKNRMDESKDANVWDSPTSKCFLIVELFVELYGSDSGNASYSAHV